MNHLKYLVYALMLFSLVSGPLYAEINSWVDENGVRRYSDSPPGKPEGPVEVIEGIKSKEPPKSYQQTPGDLEQRTEEIKAEEEANETKKILEKQKAGREEKIKSAYESLSKLKALAAGEIDWDEYERLLADAKQKLDALAGITEGKDAQKRLLTEAYESYALVPELKRLEVAGHTKSLIAGIEKMNEEWGTEAPNNYFQARKICWQRAADRLDESAGAP
jgi:hypothetical protein